MNIPFITPSPEVHEQAPARVELSPDILFPMKERKRITSIAVNNMNMVIPPAKANKQTNASYMPQAASVSGSVAMKSLQDSDINLNNSNLNTESVTTKVPTTILDEAEENVSNASSVAYIDQLRKQIIAEHENPSEESAKLAPIIPIVTAENKSSVNIDDARRLIEEAFVKAA